MELTVTQRSEKEVENCDYRDAIQYVGVYGGKEVKLQFSDGEPEDANLSRDFNDVYSIESLVQMAYDAGKAGAELKIISLTSDEL